MERIQGVKHIFLYGLIIAILIFALKWLQWKYLIIDHAIDIYVGLIAILFTALGVWTATQLLRPKTHTVIVEKEILVGPAREFVLNEAELKRLDLTSREYEILQLIAQGYSNADIAEQLFLSINTIKTHLSKLYAKMEVKGRFQAIARAKERSIIS